MGQLEKPVSKDVSTTDIGTLPGTISIMRRGSSYSVVIRALQMVEPFKVVVTNRNTGMPFEEHGNKGDYLVQYQNSSGEQVRWILPKSVVEGQYTVINPRQPVQRQNQNSILRLAEDARAN